MISGVLVYYDVAAAATAGAGRGISVAGMGCSGNQKSEVLVVVGSEEFVESVRLVRKRMAHAVGAAVSPMADIV